MPTLRFARASSPAVVLGRGQSRALVAEHGQLPVIVRSSGGGAVLYDENLLALDVLVPAGHAWAQDRLGDVFERVGELWAGALGDLGVTAEVWRGASQARRRGTPREQLLAAVCYATRGRGEVLVGDRKLVGLAQRRRRPGVLVQCGLVRRWRPARLLELLGADVTDPEILGAAVGLDDLLGSRRDRTAAFDGTDERVMAALLGRLGIPRTGE